MQENNTPNPTEEKKTTFKKIQELQFLIKQESSAREIFVKAFQDVVKKVENDCIKLFEYKIEALHFYNYFESGFSQLPKYVLETNYFEYLSQSTDYVKGLITVLKERPDVVAKLLYYCKGSDQKNALSSFFSNFFYENILSSYFIENDFLIVLYLGLKKEISHFSCQTTPKDFLPDKTINRMLLSGLIRKDDVKSYFRKILQSIIEKIDSREDNEILTLSIQDLAKISKDLQKKLFDDSQRGLKRQSCMLPGEKSKTVNSDEHFETRTYTGTTVTSNQGHFNDNMSVRSSEFSRLGDESMEEDQEEEKKSVMAFNSYLEGFTKISLLELMKKEKNENKKEFIIKQLGSMAEDDTIYETKKFTEQILKTKFSTDIFHYYRKNFNIIKDYLNLILKNLNDNIEIIPYSLKCICKIIFVLIHKKMNNLTSAEIYSYIAEFFFEILMKPIFISSQTNGVLSLITSSETKKIIIFIQKIFKMLFSENFYKASEKNELDFIVFNGYFLEVIPQVLKFYENLVNVKLPKVIEDLIENDNAEFIYDPLKFSEDEISIHQSVCFPIDTILKILEIIDKHQEEFFQSKPKGKDEQQNKEIEKSNLLLKKICQRLLGNDTYLMYLLNKKEEEEKKNIKTFLLITDIKFSEEMKKLSKISNQSSCFTIKEEGLDDKAKTLVNSKNFLCRVLFNFQKLTQDIFNSPIETTEEIFRSLRVFLQTDYYLFYNFIPLDWYGQSLENLLAQIPPEYKKDDYSKFYEELGKEVQDSINILDIRKLGKLTEKLNYTSRAIKNTMFCIEKLRQFNLYSKIQKFIEETLIDVTFGFEKKDEKKVMFIKRDDESKSRLEKLSKIMNFSNSCNKCKKSHVRNVKKIRDFISNFPSIVRLQEHSSMSLREYSESSKVPEIINSYLSLIKTVLKADKYFSSLGEEDFNQAYLQINDYIMTRLNHKLYSREANIIDLNIYQRCIQLSWIEPCNLIPNYKNLILDNFLQDTIGFIRDLDMEQSPIKKIGKIKKIADVVQRTIIFSTGRQDNSVDDALPLMQYAFIKADPLRLDSNVEFLELYLDQDLRKKDEGVLLSQMSLIKESLKNLNFSSLYNVTNEEYIIKTNSILSGDK